MSCPLLQLGFANEFEGKNFCSALFVDPKLPLIANGSRLNQRLTPLAAILLLPAVLLPIPIFKPFQVYFMMD